MFDLLLRNWWVLIVRGLLAIAFGVLAFSRPGITLEVLIIFFGAYVFLDGIFAIIQAFGHWEEREDRWLLVLEGIAGIGIGIITFRAPGITVLSLVLYIAAWSLVIGALRIAVAVRLRRVMEHEWLLALSGIISILFAAVLMWNPTAGALAL